MAVLAAGPAGAAQPASGPSSPASRSVVRLLEVLRKNDVEGFSKVAPSLVIMAAPDFGVPVPFADARKLFEQCVVSDVMEASPIKDMPAYYAVAATMTCAAEPPRPAATVEFLADGKQVYVIYPRGMHDGQRPHTTDRREAAP